MVAVVAVVRFCCGYVFLWYGYVFVVAFYIFILFYLFRYLRNKNVSGGSDQRHRTTDWCRTARQGRKKCLSPAGEEKVSEDVLA